MSPLWIFRTLILSMDKMILDLAKLIRSDCNKFVKMVKTNYIELERQKKEINELKLENKEYKEKIIEQNECIICIENKLQIVFVPCGHICSCVECSKRLNQCPICRKNIDSCLKIFF